MQPPPRPHDRFVAPARARPELWRLGLGALVVAAIVYGLNGAIFAVARAALSDAMFWRFVADVETGRAPLGLLVLLCSIGSMAVGAAVAARMLHERDAATLIGPAGLALRQFLRTLGALLALFAAIWLLPPWNKTDGLQPGLPLTLWLLLLPAASLAVLIQSGAEEVLFRGYLQQQLAARFDTPLVWMGVPSALFAIGHHAPLVYGSNAWLVTAWALCFGLVAADLTARAGTLGPAIAVHFVSNAFGMLVISMQGDLSGLALFLSPFGPSDEDAVLALLPVDFATLLACWLAARWTIRR